jgi:hypothetical protein
MTRRQCSLSAAVVLIILFAAAALRTALSAPASESQARSAAITQAVEHCADQMAPTGPQYWHKWRPIVVLSESRTVLCFDGRISDDLELWPFRQLHDRGILVIRSPGGNQLAAIAVANLLLQKRITVVVRDFCLSACANALLIASDRTHVLRNAVVAWNGGLSGCREPEVDVALSRLELPCYNVGVVRDFFRARVISDQHTILPQTLYTKSRFAAVVRSASNKQSVLWMWHPANHRDYFRNQIAYEAYPEHQEAVDAVIRKFGLHLRIVYDPAE